MAHERQCTICGSTYKYCPRCKQFASLERWHSLFCTENCKSIYEVTNYYMFNNISSEDAKTILESCDLSVVNNEEVKTTIDEIMGAKSLIKEEPKKKRKQKVEEEVPVAEPVLEKNIILEEEIVNVD